MRIDELVEELSNLNIIDAIELVKKLEKRWGVSSMLHIGKLVSYIITDESIEQQTEFDVVLTDCGPRKIETIKAIRVLTNYGLKEAKELSEGYSGGIILRGADKDTALRALDELEKVGATVKLL